jgi:sulfonate dioxygenase
MAPSTITDSVEENLVGPSVRGALDISKASFSKIEKRKQIQEKYPYEYLTPAFPEIDWAPLEELPYTDKGLGADPNYTNLFKSVKRVTHLQPKIGTILEGVKLAELTDVQRDELALLTAYRGVVFIKDQQEFDINQQLELGRYWGNLHRHATTALPKGWKDQNLDEVHVVFTDEKNVPTTAFTQTFLWHSDVTYEKQPPSYTTLKLLDGPSEGGDTSWASGYGLYDSLSPGLKQYLETHTALHSAVEQAEDAKRSGKHVRRQPVITEHPLVRVHPVTGYKSLFVNPGFTRSIVGVPKGESDAILNYLFSLIATSHEISVRFKWSIGDLALWDNRVTVHSASYGFYPNRRHAVRVTVHGETPKYDENGTSQQELLEANGVKRVLESRGGNYND